MPRKLGQHFLIRQATLERIAKAVCPEREPLVIEIGPGKGALTRSLLERADRVIAIELDSELVEFLRAKFAGDSRLTVIAGDVLTTDLGQWGPAAIAGNLPYYITSPIISKVLEQRLLHRGVFLVQKEVADRLATGPGSRDYGYLSVKTQLFSHVKVLFTVAPGAFHPPPKVMSAVVRLDPVDRRGELGITDPGHFLEFVGKCFQQKRKTIRNNLPGYPSAGRFTALRAEQLSMAELAELYKLVQSGPPQAQAVGHDADGTEGHGGAGEDGV